MHFDVHFWESVCFVLLIVLSYRPAKKAILQYLADYTKKVKQKVAEAENLYKEASSTLKHYTKQHEMFTGKIESISQKTKKDIQILQQSAEQKLAKKMHAKQQIQKEKLNLYQQQEKYKLKKKIINTTMILVTSYLEEHEHSSKDVVASVINASNNQPIFFDKNR